MNFCHVDVSFMMTLSIFAASSIGWLAAELFLFEDVMNVYCVAQENSMIMARVLV